MRKRTFRLCRGRWSSSGGKDRSTELRLSGQWLRDYGFQPGQYVELTPIESGVIQIRVQFPEAAIAFSKAVEPFAKLGL